MLGRDDTRVSRWKSITNKGVLQVKKEPKYFDSLQEAFSLERFQRYLDWKQGNQKQALDLYSLNTCISESLYTPLQILEIVLRNRCHSILSGYFGDNWFDNRSFLLSDKQKKRLQEVKDNINGEGKDITAGDIIAGLTFGFWTELLSPKYENLWQQVLHKIAKRDNGKGLTRKDFTRSLSPIRVLRNRIAHHEPIVHWDLQKHYRNIEQIIHWLSPSAAKWNEQYSRFTEIYPAQGIQLYKMS